MDAREVVLYLLAAFTLGSGLFAVTTRRIFRAAVYLLFSLLGLAGIYFWMHMEFLAAVQVFIYVGGIVVLIIFSLFLTQQTDTLLPVPPMMRRVLAGVLCGGGWLVFSVLLVLQPLAADPHAVWHFRMAEIGSTLLSIESSGMMLPFEVISLLLLAAMIGCIVLAMQKSKTEG